MNFPHSSLRREVCAIRCIRFVPNYYKTKGTAIHTDDYKNHHLTPMGAQRLTDPHCSEKA